MAEAGAKLCVTTMKKIEDGTVTYIKQNEADATHTSMIQKKLGKINWNMSAITIERLIRGLNPWPSAYTMLDEKTLKIWKATAIDSGESKQAGCIVKAEKKNLWIQTGNGILALEEVQLEGKKRMSIEDFLRGYSVLEGIFLNEEK